MNPAEIDEARAQAQASIAACSEPNALKDLDDVEDVKVEIVWSPRWDPRIHASEDIKIKYNLW